MRDLYRTLDKPGANPMKERQEDLDAAVRAAYGIPLAADPLAYILDLNAQVAEAEAAGEVVQGAGLPASVGNPASCVTKDCISP